METVGIARLTRTIPSQRAISASVSRREINAALDDTDGIPELRLDVISVDRGERGTISMTWSRDELERLLEAASENEVVLTFDEAELASVLADVEAHGMRTGAAVFAVAAAGALGTGASMANASIAGGEGGGTAATPISATAPAAAADASLARSEAMNEQYGLGAAGDAAAVSAIEQRGAAMNEAYGLGVSATDSDTASGGGDGVPVDDALLFGGLLLTIAGAAFVVRRSATPPLA